MTENERIDRRLWSDKARHWDAHIGPDGDTNRRFTVHPVLFRMLGEVAGQDVLDAGCGTAYLSILLARRGAHVTAIDYAPGMVEVARENIAAAGAAIDCRQDSCCVLETVPDASCDAVVSNYVLQDLEDLDGALRSFRRVLRPGGRAVLVFGHPCFMTPNGVDRNADGTVGYRWPFPYFDHVRCEEEWPGTDRHTGERFAFPDRFTFYHRPLSSYWKAMRAAGFSVEDFDEPTPERPFPPELAARLQRSRETAFSVAFLLRCAG